MNGKMGHHNKAFPAYRLPTRCRLVPSSLVAHHVCLLVHLTQMVGIARTVTEACEFASYEGGEAGRHRSHRSYYLTEKRSNNNRITA